MNLTSGIILVNSHQAVIPEGNNLVLLGLQGYRQRLTSITETADVRFLCASNDGEHFAYWDDQKESFFLIDAKGNEIWKRRINTDKNAPLGIFFSSSGDAVAFIDEGEYGERLWFYNLKKKYTTDFRSFYPTPIGYDADLHRFIEAKNVHPVKIPATLSVLDRHKAVRLSTQLPLCDWMCLNIQERAKLFVVLRERDLMWLSSGSNQPGTILKDCIPDNWYRKVLSTEGDLALVQSVFESYGCLVNRTLGLVWEAENLSSVMLREQRVVTHYTDGRVEVIDGNGAADIKISPVSGYKIAAADILANTLYIANIALADGTLEFRSYPVNSRIN